MKIYDAHVHVIEKIAGFGRRGELRAVGGGRARWANGEEEALIPQQLGDTGFSPESLLRVMDGGGVEKAVLMQGPYFGFQNEYAFEAVKKYPGRFAAMAGIDPYCAGAAEVLRRCTEEFGFRGMKLEMSTTGGFMGYHPDFSLLGGQMDLLWRYIESRSLNVSLDIGTFGTGSFQIDEIVSLAGKMPGCRFVIEHAFCPGRDRDADVAAALRKIAPKENIFVTLAGLPSYTAPEGYPFPSAGRYIGLLRDFIGAKRIMWGSDMPGVLIKNSYDELKRYIMDSEIFTGEELADVFSGTASTVYGI